ncbi:hypothetical protein AYI70_g3758 [Smittium culicis]|uniref:Uncharacterized protein n=1 Tax=Smittium culicis TaxID=133412 RepID=A0A1R1Y1Z3_9FUNG|nr:hypothetical protein AYI70_g3758 [Smittium culicis]
MDFIPSVFKLLFGLCVVTLSSIGSSQGEGCQFEYSNLAIGASEKLTSLGSIKFDMMSQLKIPCGRYSFRMMFDGNMEKDIYFVLSNKKDLNQGVNIYGRVGLQSGNFSMSTENASRSSIIEPTILKKMEPKVEISFDSPKLSILVSSTSINFIDGNEYDIDELFSTDEMYLTFGLVNESYQISNIIFDCMRNELCDIKSEQTSEISSTQSCHSKSDIPYFDFNTTSTRDLYVLDKPIHIPCKTKDFSVYLFINYITGIRVAFTGDGGIYGKDGVFEAKLYVTANKYMITRGRYASPRKIDYIENSNLLSKRIEIGAVFANYKDGVLSIQLDGNDIVSYKVNNLNITTIYIANNEGHGFFFMGSLTCSSYYNC